MLFEAPQNTNELVLPLSNFPTGVLWLKVQSKNQTVVHKIIKQE
jgi:hypothetical protein